MYASAFPPSNEGIGFCNIFIRNYNNYVDNNNYVDKVHHIKSMKLVIVSRFVSHVVKIAGSTFDQV